MYRGLDTRLSREVAIKVLPAELASDPERLKRFEKEARSASALNHPNIVTIYDIGSSEGTSYIAMERVDGVTLRALMLGGALPMKKLFQIAPQITEGLSKAHEAGIVHRDLKPENVMVTKDGLVKILDFGLAKLTSTMSGSGEGSQLPTMTGTTPGVVVGTVGYMSPEQANGASVDFRSDQFAFGSMLYEMVTGKRAFQKKTAVDTLAAILNEEPESIAAVNPQAPVPLRWIVERCLAKEPRGRYASTEDLARELTTVRDHLSEVSGSGETAAMPTRRRTRRLWLSMAATAAAFAVILTATFLRRPPRPSSTISSSLILPEKMILGNLALSPDGKLLAFTADTGGVLWIRALDGTAAQPSTVGGDAALPFWSPDSRFVAFFSDGKLKQVDSAGGMIQTICDAEAGGGGSWGPDGTILFAPTSASALYRVSASGGQPVAVTKLDASRHETYHRYPFFLPDGRHFLYVARGTTTPPVTIRLASLDGKVDKAVVPTSSNAAYAAGHLLYAPEGTLSARPFDLGRLETTGDTVPIAQALHMHFRHHFQFGATQRLLVFARSPTSPPSTLLWIDRSGKPGRALGEPGYLGAPRLSPDGRKVAVDVQDPARNISDVWIYDAATGMRDQVRRRLVAV